MSREHRSAAPLLIKVPSLVPLIASLPHQPFHADLCDVLALYALNVAAYGGESFLASSAKIYNELARTRPDIIEVLAKDDWIFDE